MSTSATLEKLKKMRLPGMRQAYSALLDSNQTSSMTADEVLSHLVEREWENRANSRLNQLLKAARLRYNVTLEYVSFKPERNLNKQEFIRLCECEFIRQNKNICISGATGSGKSYLVSVLGQHACLFGHKVRYFNCIKFFPLLEQAKADGSYVKIIKSLGKVNLLILDDFGLEAITHTVRIALLEILDEKTTNGAIIAASQIPTEKWHQLIGEPTLADAICDRRKFKPQVPQIA